MTKEGRLVSELSAQIRQKNLAIFLNIPEVLTLDWTIIKKLNAYIHVWESRKIINKKLTTIKANAAVYPELPSNPFRTKIITYMRRKRSNPMLSQSRPFPAVVEPGNPIGENFKKPWYPVPEDKYRAKKESILDKYDVKKGVIPSSMMQRNKAMALLKERTTMSIREIAKALNMGRNAVDNGIKGGIV